jgi:hypothetical protein
MLNLDERLLNLHQSWKDRIIQNSQFFIDSDQALHLLIEGYKKVFSIHDYLIEIAAKEKISEKNWKPDIFLGNLYYLFTNRQIPERMIRKDSSRLFRFLTFESNQQIKYLKLIFDMLPFREVSSLEQLRFSTLGDLQFPKLYFLSLQRACKFALREYSRYGHSWNAEEFEKVFNSVIRGRTDFTGSRGSYDKVRELIVPGSYGSGKKR